MTWWEGRWVARMMITPGGAAAGYQVAGERGEGFSRCGLGADGGGEVGVLVDDDQVDALAGLAGDLPPPGGGQVVIAGVHDGLEGLERVDGVGDGRADEHVGAGPPQAELDLLAVDQDELAVMGQRAVRGDQVQPGGFARAGFAAEQHVAFGQVDVDVRAVFVAAQVHRVEHGEREGGDRRQRPGVSGSHGVSFGWGRRPPVWPGTAVPGYAAGSPSSGGESSGGTSSSWPMW